MHTAKQLSKLLTSLEMTKEFENRSVNMEKISNIQRYKERFVGSTKNIDMLKYEIYTTLIESFPGAVGIFLRQKFAKYLLKEGKNIFIGRGVNFKVPQNIRIRDNVIIDDYCTLDAKDRGSRGIIIEKDTIIGRFTIISSGYSGFVNIGKKAYIGALTQIHGLGGITIGDEVMIAGHTFIVAAEHIASDTNKSMLSLGYSTKGIVIEDDVWIGANVKVLDGVTIHKGSIIGAGSVVNKDIPPYSVAVGIPARVVKNRKQ